MRHRLTALTVMTAGLLASCGQSTQTDTPVVRVTPGTGDTVTSFQVQLNSTTRVLKGPGQGHEASSPTGLRLAYLFDQGHLRVRADLPGTSFPDGEARVLLMDPSGRSAQVLLRGTLAPDRTIDPDLVRTLGQNVAGQTAGLFDLMDPAHPFRKLSTDQFLVLARKAAFDVTSTSGTQVILTRNLTQGSTQTRLKLTFDETVGAVTQTDSVTVTPDVQYSASSAIAYADVQGLTQTAVPYEITTRMTSTLIGDEAQAPIHLPVADEHLAGQAAPTLKEGEYVAQSFTAVPGEGVTDINTSELTSSTTFEDIAVNAVQPDFFTPEAN